MLTHQQRNDILQLALSAREYERYAVQNMEFGHNRSVESHQNKSDKAIRELREYLENLVVTK